MKLLKLKKFKVYSPSHFSKTHLALFGLVFAGLGGLVIFNSFAATSTASIEPESGTVIAPATVVNDATASGGKVVVFGTASVSGTCPPYPAFPDENCTGWRHTGVTLSAYTGPININTNGTVIDGKDINSCLNIYANNVTIKNSRIRCAGANPRDAGYTAVYFRGGYTNLTITDTEITRPTGSSGGLDYSINLEGTSAAITRVDMWNMTSGVHLTDDNASVTDSYIHDLVNISGEDHNDGILANGHVDNVQLIHNNIENPLDEVTPIAMYPEGTPNTYWTIDKNLLNGGGFCMFPSYTKGSEQPNNHITVTDNHFGRKFYPQCGAGAPVDRGRNGASFFDGAGNTWTNNTWHDTGAAVSP